MFRSYRYFSAALFAIGALATTPACAYPTYGSQGGYYRDIERRAYDNGYREGLRQGENDARRGRDFSYSRHDAYHDADDGYRRVDGDREFYRRNFRQGFQAGYSESFNRYAAYGRYPGSTYPTYPSYPSYPTYPSSPGGVAVPRGSYGSVAAQSGYRDGFDAGRSDAHDRAAYDPARSKRYREGDHDYNGRYGSRDDYKRDYRAAFQQGYRDGYSSR